MISLQLELSCSLSFPSLFLISLFLQERYLKKIKAICQGMQRTPSEIPNINNLRRHLSLWSRSTTDICSSASAKPPWHIQVFLCCLSSREDRDNDTTTVKELTHALHTPVFFYTTNILVKLASSSHMVELLPAEVNQGDVFPLPTGIQSTLPDCNYSKARLPKISTGWTLHKT